MEAQPGPGASARSGATGAGSGRGQGARKVKKARRRRAPRPDYTVQQGEDMLLYISSSSSQAEGSLWTGRRRKPPTAQKHKKKKRLHPKPPPPMDEEAELQLQTEDRWGQRLPEELLVSVFQLAVDQDGAVPFLCRAGRVCRRWNAAAATPLLWRKVTLGHCWIQPARGQTERTTARIHETLEWLALSRFSQLTDFTLCHWASSVDFAVETVSRCCPHLQSLHLSFCRGLTSAAFHTLGQHSHALRRLNLQHSVFQVDALVEYLEKRGEQISQLLFTRSHNNDRVLAAVTRGCCPDLEVLEVNKRLDSKDTELSVCFQSLQRACPRLKVFRMFNIQIQHKAMRKRDEVEAGFPLLEEFCIANTEYSYTTDRVLLDILSGSAALRVLDLRGSTRITTAGLAQLPCPGLECLFWGQYFSQTPGFTSVKKNLSLLMEKWGGTLRQLDLTNQPFGEDDLQGALALLGQLADAHALRSINLSGTKVTAPALRTLLQRLTNLNYLNLSSCRNLPRGAKKIYRSPEDVRRLQDVL